MSPRSAEASDGVAFLTSLLIRFPELGSATLGPRLGELRLEFYLDQEIDSARFTEFVEKFRMSWDLFFDLVRAQTSDPPIARPRRAARGTPGWSAPTAIPHIILSTSRATKLSVPAR